MIEQRQGSSLKDEYLSNRSPQDDGSIQPATDTGFRMGPVEPFTYTRKHIVAATYPTYEYIHNDDVIVVGNATLRGVPINRVNAIAINQEQHDARETKYLRDRIAKHRRDNDRFWDENLHCFVSYN